jgi:hypothetical protein
MADPKEENSAEQGKTTPHTDNETRSAQERKKKNKRKLVLLLLLLALLLLFFFQYQLNQYKRDVIAQQQQNTLDSLAYVDSLRRADSLANALNQQSQQTADSLLLDSLLRDSLFQDSLKRDSLQKAATQRHSSTSQATPDTTPAKATVQDSTPPTPQITPPPGRYFGETNVTITCLEPRCTVQYSFSPSQGFAPYTQPITIAQDQTLYFNATDSAGNQSATRSAAYDISKGSNICGKNMMPIPVNGTQICMDIYEWPNTEGSKPTAFVSQQEAAQMCEESGKRLCTLQEWQQACKGKESFAYPYGNAYDPAQCYTATAEPGRSGRRVQCRSYYGIYDMSGNVWEWTSTPYKAREGFVYVTGGAWSTQNQSRCTDNKFSFYPQNKYPFVGFRCCK